MSTRGVSIGTWDVDPHYVRESASGQNGRDTWNPYVMTRSEYLCSPSPYGYWWIPGQYIIPWDAADDAKLQDKLVSAVKGHEFNMAVFAGQAHEVAKSVVGTTTAVISGIKSLKRGDLNGALKSLVRVVPGTDLKRARNRLHRNDIAGTWLALAYGWLPLYDDVYNAAQAFEVMSKPPHSSTVVVSRRKKEDFSGQVGPCTFAGQAERLVRLEYTMTEMLSYERIMGLASPLEVAWELTPWSFVADWFLPIGDYLERLSIIPHLRGEFRYTAMYRSRSKITGVVDPVTNYKSVGCSGNMSQVHMVRYAPTSSIGVATPKLKGLDSLYKSSKRTANAIALLSQLIK